MRVTGLVDCVESFCSCSDPDNSPAQLCDDLIFINQAIDRLQLEFCRLAAAFADGNEPRRPGALAPKDWLRHNCNLSGRIAADRLCVGEELANLPESEAAAEEGEIGFGHLALIARTYRAISESPTASGPATEEPLLRNARDRGVDAFWYACVKLRHAADPDGVQLDEADAILARRFQMSGVPGGLVALSGRLDPAGAAALRSALEPLARPDGKNDHRRRDQRMGDALVEISMHAMDQGTLPSHGSMRPHLQLTVPLETLLGLAGTPAADLEYGDPISSRLVEQLSCDCSLTKILLDRDGQVLEVNRTRRLTSPAQNRALRLRDKGCVCPGCERPAAWTTPHHLKHWVKGGATDLPNLVLLCYRHHSLVHQFGWQIVPGDDGRWAMVPPAVHWIDSWQTQVRVQSRLQTFSWFEQDLDRRRQPAPEPAVSMPF